MLREGWDVQNVTVVVGLRPNTATANILPEQAIGRGLRLMFRGFRRSLNMSISSATTSLLVVCGRPGKIGRLAA